MKVNYENFDKFVSVDFKGISQEQIKTIDFWIKRFTPSVKVTEKYKSNYKVIIKECKEDCYKELFNHSIIMGKIAGNEGAIGKYISQVFQKLVINQKVIYVHASCVSKGNDGVIIIGDFGQGKTSVALECTRQDKEVQPLSDNGIAIKDNKIIGYANSIALRTVNTNMLNKIDDKEVTLKCDNMTFFDFEPNLIGSINIKSIIIPHINAEDNNIYNVDEEKGKWYLYNKFTSLLNGETLLFNGSVPTKVFSTKNNLEIILGEVNNLIKSVPLKYVSCNFNGIIREVVGDLNGKEEL